jgi:glyoxylase-like metal-dependent hydrolase (beta-lactamase superfamily II)
VATSGGHALDLEDRAGDRIDLGDRSLRVLHTPGHSPDHVCLVDEHRGILFSGDQAAYGPLLVNLGGADLDDWVNSARRLAEELHGAIRVIYASHCLRTIVPPKLLREIAQAGEEIVGGAVALRPGHGFYGEPVRAADFDHFSVLLAEEDT